MSADGLRNHLQYSPFYIVQKSDFVCIQEKTLVLSDIISMN